MVLILFLGGTISDKLAQSDTAKFAYDFTLLSGKFALHVQLPYSISNAFLTHF